MGGNMKYRNAYVIVLRISRIKPCKIEQKGGHWKNIVCAFKIKDPEVMH